MASPPPIPPSCLGPLNPPKWAPYLSDAATFVKMSHCSASQSLFPSGSDGRWTQEVAEDGSDSSCFSLGWSRPVPLLSSVGGGKRLRDCLKILLSLAGMERRREVDSDELG